MPVTWSIRAIGALGLTAVVLAGFSSSGDSSTVHRANPALKVTITRDSAGIPHITASNFTALGYGEALAFARDNFCTLAQDFVTVNGQRSKYFGAKALSLNSPSNVLRN